MATFKSAIMLIFLLYMSTKQNIQNEIEELKARIADLEKKAQPKVKYNENGSLAVKPEIGDTYWFINSYGKVDYAGWTDDHMDYYHFQTENCFDTEEAGLIWADVLKTHYRLLEKIKEINESVGWVADWENENQPKYYLSYFDSKVRSEYVYCTRSSLIFMSKEAKDYIMSDEVSDEDRIKFLKIVKR